MIRRRRAKDLILPAKNAHIESRADAKSTAVLKEQTKDLKDFNSFLMDCFSCHPEQQC